MPLFFTFVKEKNYVVYNEYPFTLEITKALEPHSNRIAPINLSCEKASSWNKKTEIEQ